jgi:DNA-binding transcriptional LysR family regulator
MRLDPRRLLWLLATHRAGGIHAAAQTEHVSASAISQQIARLEAELGVRVLNRHPQGVTLTPAGKALVESAERIELELAEARRAITTLASGINGRVAVGGLKTVTVALLVPLIAKVEALYAGIEVAVRQADGEDAIRQLSSGELDLLVLEADSPTGHVSRRGTVDRILLDDRWLVAVPKTMTIPRTLEDLGTLVWLGADERAAAHAATNALLEGLPNAKRSSHVYDDYEVALAMVAAGLGVALVPEMALTGQVTAAINVICLPGLGARRLLVRVRSPRARLASEVSIVLDELVDLAAARNYSAGA